MQKLIWNITIVLGVVLAGALTTSCYDDKGNYDYIRLDEIVIDTKSGIMAKKFSKIRMLPWIMYGPSTQHIPVRVWNT